MLYPLSLVGPQPGVCLSSLPLINWSTHFSIFATAPIALSSFGFFVIPPLPLPPSLLRALVVFRFYSSGLLTDSFRFTALVSASRISKSDDRAMDGYTPSAKMAPPGISIRNGPVNGDRHANGFAKRKSRGSIDQSVNYKDESDSDDDAPLVRLPTRICVAVAVLLSLLTRDFSRPSARNRRSLSPTAKTNRLCQERGRSCLCPSRTRPSSSLRATRNP